MHIGLHPVSFTFPGGTDAIPHELRALAAASEDAGLDSLLLMDHYLQLPVVGEADEPMLEGYTTLGYLAGNTHDITLGLLVTGVTYRHPALLVKIVTTLDVLSAGRTLLGIGAAWFEREHSAYGVPFPPLAQRFEHLEDALGIAQQMWSDDDGPFDGHHHHLAETICSPRPVQRPHPPILVGGGGEKKTLRLVARYADASNIVPSSPEEAVHKMRVLDAHCADIGRDPAEIQRTIMLPGDPFESAERFLTDLEAYADAGVDATVLVPPGDDPVGFVERVGEEIVPFASELT